MNFRKKLLVGFQIEMVFKQTLYLKLKNYKYTTLDKKKSFKTLEMQTGNLKERLNFFILLSNVNG